MERSIGVDVDLTIVDTLTEWVEWWEEKTGKEFPWHKIGSDFSINDALKEHMDATAVLDFWKKEDLYDDLEPIYGVFKTLSLLSTGYDIYFLSHCQPEHFESKKRFLDRYFPFHSGLINTSRKYQIECDIYFDDHCYYVEKIIEHRPHSKVYQYVTADNIYQLVDGATPLYTWSDFYELHLARG